MTEEGPVTIRARANGTVAYLKKMVQLQLYISPRLEIRIFQQRTGQPVMDDALIANVRAPPI